MEDNEVVLFNGLGQMVTRFVNYKRNVTFGNLPAGIYFYRIKIFKQGKAQYYTGKVMVIE
jgi:hypothetical protein